MGRKRRKRMRLLNRKSGESAKLEDLPELQATARLHQTMASLAKLLDQATNELQSVDSEFQELVLQSAREAMEATERQAADRLKSAVEAAEQKTRVLITEELQARFRQEMTTAVEAVRSELNAERTKAGQEKERLTKATTQW